MKNIHTYLHTSESVSAGHPDKVCDQISDALLDAHLRENPFAHVAIEALATTNRVVVAGEVKGATISAQKIEEIVREVVRDIGYTQEGFHHQHFIFNNYIHQQSDDIARGVGKTDGEDLGAGDQGLMFGYATDETDEFMPAPLLYAHRILQNLEKLRQRQEGFILDPDAKSQVTVLYNDRVPVHASNIVLSTQHKDDVTLDQIKELVTPVIYDALPDRWKRAKPEIFINPTGRFVIGGPDGDTGLTGRKIIVDTYGGAAPHGGGAFSGKDPTKVDRSAAYMMRYLAKNIVAAGLAKRCTIQVSYVIGRADPLSLYVNTHRSGIVGDDVILSAIRHNINLTPKGIRDHLQLNRPLYRRTASFGHFGRTPEQDGGFSWEKLDAVEIFKELKKK